MSNIDWMKEAEQRKDDLLKDLIGLLNIPSVKSLETQTPESPMGVNIDKALNYALELGNKNDFTTKNIEGYAGYIEYGDSDDYIGVLAHVDVVPATASEWDTPPFDATIVGDKLIARGAIDDKGPGMAAFYALKILKELGVPIKRRIRLIFGTDEESGMRCIRHYLKVEQQPIFGFSPDADFPIIHAEKGQIHVKITRPAKKSDIKDDKNINIHHFHSGERSNMVPGQAVVQLQGQDLQAIPSAFQEYCQSYHLKGETKLISEGLELTLYGKTVHGMEPQNGVNAALELLYFLNTLPLASEDQAFANYCSTHLYRDPFGKALGISYSEPTLGPLTVNAGIFRYDHNGLDISLNIRCPLNTNYMRTVEILMESAEAFGLKVEEVRHSQPHHVSPEHPMIKTMQKAYQDITGQEPTLLTTGGGTYARLMENGVAFGASFPGKAMTAHQANEFIDIDDLIQATAIYAKALYDLSQL
ncbi:succinyl-diaminopimelate desuccinylase [Pullulanibacillus pueri]|uniref:Dipeptidase PepV n=1 Tax=Pullulanibacillus pueri TaxID=1437324 RepID=A0A8J2ZXD9_9BACL|nr:dipeptidase PepV [Pullulanibacillus pueri]MBM7682857.1 succinyl-diaminopimelate desuccinylase [Pullulanibacillus pueri]GGH84305.1 dipeptidase PepV [Pullulanibacillus pueri]